MGSDPVAVDAGVVARADAVMDAIGAAIGAPDPAEWRDEETGMAVKARAAIAVALHRAGEEMRERAAKVATDRYDVAPEDDSEPAAFHAGWERCARQIATAKVNSPPTSEARVTAWARAIHTPSSAHGPAEYDVDMVWGDDPPDGDGWFPLYREPRLSAPEAGAGLVRYGFERDDEADGGWAFLPTATGAYVRYDDHAAALAAERERRERDALAQVETLKRRVAAAEAERDRAMKACEALAARALTDTPETEDDRG